jgi:hypothetical protein
MDKRDYEIQMLHEQVQRLEADKVRLRKALEGIDTYGHANPGMGFNCGEAAHAALADDGGR